MSSQRYIATSVPAWGIKEIKELQRALVARGDSILPEFVRELARKKNAESGRPWTLGTVIGLACVFMKHGVGLKSDLIHDNEAKPNDETEDADFEPVDAGAEPAEPAEPAAKPKRKKGKSK